VRILVGVDGSGPSDAAMTWALQRARGVGAEVVAIHVVDDEWGQLGIDYASAETAAGSSLLDEAVDAARGRAPQLEITSQLLHGSFAWELAHAAHTDDLIVIGTHKTGYLQGRVLGSTSVVVASIASCTVAVIPDGASSRRSGVVVGVAPGEFWKDAVIAGSREAEALGQDLTLVHALPVRDDDSAALLLDQGRGLLAAAAILAAETSPGLITRSRLSRRRPAEALLDASRTGMALVLGVSRRSPANAGFIGSVTHDVLLNLHSPVLIARLPDAQ
jgi:nucleotide-binding universal stress UspA family protein